MKLLRDPLFHFAVLGTLLYLGYAAAGGLLSTDDARRIAIGREEIDLLAGTFERQWGRPPRPDELQGLIRSRVREEVLYREALAVGLDRDDAVVRRRMVQKMEMLSQDLALLADPTEAELRSFHADHIDDYRVPPRITFSHVYFSADRRGRAAAEDEARRLLAALRAEDPPPAGAPERGDRLMLETEQALRSPDDVRQMFGDRFAGSLFGLQPGWHGPIESSYGIHLVNVIERIEGRVRPLDEIRDRVVGDFDRVRRERANEALYEGLVERYEVVIDGEATGAGPVGIGD